MVYNPNVSRYLSRALSGCVVTEAPTGPSRPPSTHFLPYSRLTWSQSVSCDLHYRATPGMTEQKLVGKL